jgi:co-chaperonin GroES (HSP10)
VDKIIKVHLTRYVCNHPIAINTPDRVYEIAEMENAVVVNVNKQAKLEYGKGTQIEVSVGDRLSKQQAIQIANTYETTLIAISSDNNTSTEQSSLLKG